jgi:hypothetical protein
MLPENFAGPRGFEGVNETFNSQRRKGVRFSVDEIKERAAFTSRPFFYPL